ncbi:MAG: TetR/AcrR family transcriptional regulator [Myxococcota bacterium]
MPPHDPRKVPRQRRARETVRAILDATAHILRQDESLTTNRVAEVAGVSIGSLYQYFPDKDALVAALVERTLAEDLAWVADQLEPGPLRPQVPHLIEAICTRQRANAALLASLLPRLPVIERDALARQAFSTMAKWLRDRLIQEPGLRPELADEVRLDQAVFVVMRALRWVLNEAALEQPEWLDTPGFRAEVSRIVEGLWDPA